MIYSLVPLSLPTLLFLTGRSSLVSVYGMRNYLLQSAALSVFLTEPHSYSNTDPLFSL